MQRPQLRRGPAGYPSFTIKELTADTFRIREAAVLPSDTGLVGCKFEGGQLLFETSGCTRCHGYRAEGSGNGPVLRGRGRRLNVLTVGAKLGSRAGEMYRRARELHIPLRSFSENEIRSLLDFLNGGSK